MTVSIRPLHPLLGAEVAGVDLRRPLGAEEVAAIEAGMDRHAVLVFHDQPLSDEQQVAFSRNFGAIEPAVNSNITKPEDRRLSVELADISNLDRDNQMLARDDRRRMFNLGNELWHSDSSFRAVPAKYSLLSARAIPSHGRQHRVRRHARGLRRARRRDQGRGRGSDLRALADLLAQPARLRRLRRGGEGRVRAGAPAAGAHPPGDRPQIAVPRLARRHDRRLADARSARVPARSDRARDPAPVRLRPPVAPARPGDVGQPPDHAPGAPLPGPTRCATCGAPRSPATARRPRRSAARRRAARREPAVPTAAQG